MFGIQNKTCLGYKKRLVDNRVWAIKLVLGKLRYEDAEDAVAEAVAVPNAPPAAPAAIVAPPAQGGGGASSGSGSAASSGQPGPAVPKPERRVTGKAFCFCFCSHATLSAFCLQTEASRAIFVVLLSVRVKQTNPHRPSKKQNRRQTVMSLQ